MKKTNLREVIGGTDTENLLVEMNELGSITDQELEQVVGGNNIGDRESSSIGGDPKAKDSRDPKEPKRKQL